MKIKFYSYIILFFCIIVLNSNFISVSFAQDNCPWDKGNFAEEVSRSSEITDFAKGYICVLPRELLDSIYKNDIRFPYFQRILNALNEKESTSKIAGKISEVEKSLYDFLIKRIKKENITDAAFLLLINYSYHLSDDWRMRGERTIRPNDKYDLIFYEIKEKVFREEISKILNVKNTELLNPENFALMMLPLMLYFENQFTSNDNSRIKRFKTSLYFSFADVLVCAGYKHSAYRIYLRCNELTDNEKLKRKAKQAAKDIKDSMRSDPAEFTKEFLTGEKSEAEKFQQKFKEFVLDEYSKTKSISLSKLKIQFLTEYSQSGDDKGIYYIIVIICLVFAAISFIAINILKSRKIKKSIKTNK